MIIVGELSSDQTFVSEWSYDPDDPLAVTVEFPEHEVTWIFSVDLLWDAVAEPRPEGLQGLGDVKVGVEGEDTFLYLDNGEHLAVLKFYTLDIQNFLDMTSYTDPDEVIARELDEFLETL